MAEKYVTQEELTRYGEFLQGQISALRLLNQFLIEELASTEESQQRILRAVKKAATRYKRTVKPVKSGEGAAEILLEYTTPAERGRVRRLYLR